MSTVGDTMSTPGEYQEYTRGLPCSVWGYHEYSWGCSVHWGDIISTLGNTKMHVGVIMSTRRGVQCTGEILRVH